MTDDTKLPARTIAKPRRSWGKRLLLATGLLVVLAAGVLGAAFVWVQNADLAPYAVGFVEKQTGLKMVAEGPLTIKLLPSPALRAEKLTIPAFRGDKPLLVVKDADIKLKWGSGLAFWQGITLDRLVMTDPTVYLLKPKSGPANWQSAEVYQEQQEHAAEGDGNDFSRSDKLPIASFGVVDVTNLNLAYVDEASGKRVVAKGVNLKADGTDLADAKLALTGTINGQPLNGQGQFDFSDLSRVPLSTKLDAAGLKLALQGEVRDQAAYTGAVNVQTPNLKATLDSLLGQAPAQAPASAFSLTGDVAAGGDKLALRNFNASLGELLKATGDVDVTMGDTPTASGTFAASGSNLRQLAELASGQKQPTLPAAPFKLSTKLSGKNEIRLDNLNFELVNLLTAGGNVAVVPGKVGELPKLDADLTLRGGNLQAVARAFGSNANLPAQSFSASAAVSGKGTYKVSDLSAQLATLASLKGDNITITPQPELKLAGDIALKGNDLGATAKAFGVRASLPRSAYNASFRLGGDKRIEVTDLVANLPGLLEATGYLNLTAAAPHDVQGVLNVSRLNLDALGYCAKQTNGGTTAETAGTAAPARSETPWSDAPLPLDGLRATTFNVTMNVKGLGCSSFPATAAEVVATNTAGELNVSKLNLTLPQGGTAAATLKLGHSGTPKLNATLTTANVPLQDLVRTLKDKGVELPLNATANLTSSGASSRALAENLAGNITFDAQNGRLPYTRMLGNLSNLAGVLQGQLPSQNDDRITSLVGKYSVNKGRVNTEQLTVTTPGMTLTGSGSINLPAWSIDYTLTPKLAAAEGLNLPILIRGALGSPNIGPDKDVLSRFTGRMTGEGVKSLLGVDKTDAKGLGGVVEGIVGGKGIQADQLLNNFLGGNKKTPAPQPDETQAPATEAPATQQEAPVTPEEAIKQLLPF
ncbi:MAG: AsmA family protein [Pseudomonadaceae bacterium]|nr:AsmA family protein [Pseudomonadaceae bacterium]